MVDLLMLLLHSSILHSQWVDNVPCKFATFKSFLADVSSVTLCQS